MKITIYELLGLVKDGKAPKKIKFRNEIYEYENNIKDGFIDYVGTDKETNEMFYLSSHFGNNCLSVFTNEVEIIEETKKIEKMECSVESWFTPSQADIEIIKKINELIDEINNLKEKKDD